MKEMTWKIVMVVIGSFLFTQAVFAKNNMDEGPVGSLMLTTQQINALGTILTEYTDKQFDIMSKIDIKLSELRTEMRKEDRFSRVKEKMSSRRANKIVRDITSLYGQMLKTRVEYLLKAKNILTMAQKEKLLAELEFFDDTYEDYLPEEFDIDLLVIPLDLTKDQVKKILSHQTKTAISELKINLDIEYQLLDLQEELEKDEVDAQKVDAIILKITDLGTKLMDARVNGMLKSKDVLNATQKKILLHSMMM